MMFFFWLFSFLIFYTFLGYPLVLWVWSRVRPRPVLKGDLEPSVSIVISAWNEENVIKRRIQNLLVLDYPVGKMEILIGSDGSDDRTVEIIESFQDERIKFVNFSVRNGKVSVLNDLIERARNEILIFSDCRQKFDHDAIQCLVGNFSDFTVGCVSGELILSDSEGGTGKGISLYWKYEKFMRNCESMIHSMIGATGAIYAIRRELFEKIPADVVLDDMFIPLTVIRKGFRAVYDSSAKAYDKVAEDPKEETRRKVRTLFGNYQIFGLFKDLLVPIRSRIAIQFFSHKILRVLAPFFLIIVFLLNIALADQGKVYFWLMVLQGVFYMMAFGGAIFRNETAGWRAVLKNICCAPYVFCLLNFSAFIGFLRFLMQDQNVMWDKAGSK